MPDSFAAALAITFANQSFKLLNGQTSRRLTVITGLALGAALSAKTTNLLLIPCFVFLLSFGFRGTLKLRSRLKTGILIICIGLFLLNATYFFQGSGLAIGEIEMSSIGLRDPKQESPNRFSASFLHHMPIPLPIDFVQGIDVQSRDFEEGRPSFANGVYSERGWKSFYIFAYFVKTPIWVLGLGCGSIFVFFFRRSFRSPVAEEIHLLAPIWLLWVVVSWQDGFSEHLRYLLPCFPFMFVFASRLGKCIDWMKESWPAEGLLVVASILIAIFELPGCIAYFNVFSGGSANAHKQLWGSNLDWGQDYFRFTHLADTSLRDAEVTVIPFAPISMRDLGFKGSEQNCAAITDEWQLPPGYVCISRNYLAGWPAGKVPLAFRELENLLPCYTVGNSLYIYRITSGMDNL